MTHEHVVQLYDDSGRLAESVVSWFAEGLADGDAVLAVATHERREAFAAGLAARGLDPAALEHDGRLLFADAARTLEQLLDHGRPELGRFDRAALGLLDRLSPPSGTTRVFGEMVDVLWQRGERRAADALERFWNRLQGRRRFALFCAYRVPDLFDRDLHVGLVPRLCLTHGDVRFACDPELLRQSIDRALADALGPDDAENVYELAASRPSPAPPHELALMWLSAHRPAAAEQVLSDARERYLASALAATS